MNTDTAMNDTDEQNSSNKSPQNESSSDTKPRSFELPIEVTPTIRPSLIWIGVTTVLGAAVIAYLMTNQQRIGPSIADALIRIVAVLTLLVVLRFLIHIFILRRTRYRVDSNRVLRRYSLLFRTWEREVPIEKVRSSEFRQSRVQTLLGYGTISVNQGLGSLELADIKNPSMVREAISTLVTEDTGRSTD